MGILKEAKDRIKKELHFQKLGWQVAGKRIKKSLQESIAEAKENQRKKRELMLKLKKAEKEGMEAAMVEEARKIGKEKAHERARTLLNIDDGITFKMPNLWGRTGDEERKSKKKHN